MKSGDKVELSKHVTLRIIQVRGKKGGGWVLHYELQDRRDPVRNLRRTPPVVVPTGHLEQPTAKAIDQAAQESAYTGGYSPLADAGEAVDEKTQRRFTKEATEGFGAHLERERKERKSRRLDERLRNVEILAREKGVDLSRKLASIERRIESAERDVGREDTA